MSRVRVALIGARIDGQAGVALDVLSYYDQYEVTCFFDSTPQLRGQIVSKIPVIGPIHEITDEQINSIDYFHISIGDNKARLDIFNFLKSKGCKLLTLKHPTSVISRTATLGEGCFIGALACIQNNTLIGNVCILNTASVTEHDNIIGNAVHMAPNSSTAGRVQLEDMSFVGLGAKILPDVKIGMSAFIGAGALVRKNVDKKTTMVGYSAKIHKKNIYNDVREINDSISSD